MSYVLIKIRMKSKLGGKMINGKAIIKDRVALTTYDDPKINENSFKLMKKQGKECELKNGILVERYNDMKKEETLIKIEKDLQQLQAKFRKIMDINYTKEVVR